MAKPYYNLLCPRTSLDAPRFLEETARMCKQRERVASKGYPIRQQRRVSLISSSGLVGIAAQYASATEHKCR